MVNLWDDLHKLPFMPVCRERNIGSFQSLLEKDDNQVRRNIAALSFNMNSSERRLVRGNYVELVRNLIPENILDYLYQENVLSEEDCENIRSGATRAQRVRILLSILPRKTSGAAMAKFIESLERAGYVELVGLMRSTDTVDAVDTVDSPEEEEFPWTQDSSLNQLKEQLEQQAQIVESMQQEMEQVNPHAFFLFNFHGLSLLRLE